MVSPLLLSRVFTDWSHIVSAILRKTSERTSYLATRLVFRRLSRVARAICTSAPVNASIIISHDFTFLMISSWPFGSQTLHYTSMRCSRAPQCAIVHNAHHIVPISRFPCRHASFHTRCLTENLHSLFRVTRRLKYPPLPCNPRKTNSGRPLHARQPAYAFTFTVLDTCRKHPPPRN